MVVLTLKAKHDHLQKVASTRDYVKALAEFVWNALDADATTVSVELVRNALGGLESIVIRDSGTGISKARAEASKPRGAAKPRGATKTPSATKPRNVTTGSQRLAQPAQPRGVPAGPRTRRPAASAPRSEPASPAPILGTAVQAAAELAEIGLALSGRALRRAIGRLPRP